MLESVRAVCLFWIWHMTDLLSSDITITELSLLVLNIQSRGLNIGS